MASRASRKLLRRLTFQSAPPWGFVQWLRLADPDWESGRPDRYPLRVGVRWVVWALWLIVPPVLTAGVMAWMLLGLQAWDSLDVWQGAEGWRERSDVWESLSWAERDSLVSENPWGCELYVYFFFTLGLANGAVLAWWHVLGEPVFHGRRYST